MKKSPSPSGLKDAVDRRRFMTGSVLTVGAGIGTAMSLANAKIIAAESPPKDAPKQNKVSDPPMQAGWMSF